MTEDAGTVIMLAMIAIMIFLTILCEWFRQKSKQ